MLILILTFSFYANATSEDLLKKGDCLKLSELKITETGRGSPEALSFIAKVSHEGFSPANINSTKSPDRCEATLFF